jgi:hypothetical protein
MRTFSGIYRGQDSPLALSELEIKFMEAADRLQMLDPLLTVKATLSVMLVVNFADSNF